MFLALGTRVYIVLWWQRQKHYAGGQSYFTVVTYPIVMVGRFHGLYVSSTYSIAVLQHPSLFSPTVHHVSLAAEPSPPQCGPAAEHEAASTAKGAPHKRCSLFIGDVGLVDIPDAGRKQWWHTGHAQHQPISARWTRLEISHVSTYILSPDL